MTIAIQNFRSTETGSEPDSLLPGQIAFNLVDKVLYIGDGSNYKTDFGGNQVAGITGNGWYAMPMDFASLSNFYALNPAFQPLPTLTTTSTTPTTLLSVPIASFRSVHIDLSVSDVTGGKYRTDTCLIIHDGATTDQIISSASLGADPYSLNSAVVGGSLVVSVTSSSANETKYVGSYQVFAI